MNICIIPARGGSRRIPGKNKRLFYGKPIIQYPIELAISSGVFDRIIVSTDDPEIRDICDNIDSPLLYCEGRKPGMEQDNVGTQEVARSVLLDNMKRILEQGYAVPTARHLVCVIYPCSPLLDMISLITGYWEVARDPKMNYAMSVGDAPLQDAGNFYWGTLDAFMDRKPLISPQTVMIPIEPGRVCDINTERDWRAALRKYEKLHKIRPQMTTQWEEDNEN